MFQFNVQDTVAFKTDGINKNIAYDQDSIKVQTICLSAGQIIPPCSMTTDVLFHVITGTGTMQVDNEVVKLSAGTVVIVPSRAGSRSIRARTDLALLAVQVRDNKKM